MKQLVSQMTQLSVHFFQPRVFYNTKRDSNNMQCYVCNEMGHILKDCLNRDAKGGPSSRRITFADDKSKVCINLVEIQDETREKAITDFE